MRILLFVAIGLSVVACSSYETTYMVTDESGHLTTKTVAGVPIVVTVPQKLGFMATKSCYRIETPRTGADGKVSVVPSDTTEFIVDKTAIPLGESKLVNLDIKRPSYGTAKTSMKMAGQYPTELSSDVDDKTLGRALDTLDKFIEKQGETTAGGGSTKTLIGQETYMVIYDPVTQRITQDRLSSRSKGCV